MATDAEARQTSQFRRIYQAQRHLSFPILSLIEYDSIIYQCINVCWFWTGVAWQNLVPLWRALHYRLPQPPVLLEILSRNNFKSNLGPRWPGRMRLVLYSDTLWARALTSRSLKCRCRFYCLFVGRLWTEWYPLVPLAAACVFLVTTLPLAAVELLAKSPRLLCLTCCSDPGIIPRRQMILAGGCRPKKRVSIVAFCRTQHLCVAL